MSAKNKEIVEKVNASFAEGGVEGFLSHCADDVVWTIIGEKRTKGKKAIREWMSAIDIEPPKFTVDKIVAEGDFVTPYGDINFWEKEDGAPARVPET